MNQIGWEGCLVGAHCWIDRGDGSDTGCRLDAGRGCAHANVSRYQRHDSRSRKRRRDTIRSAYSRRRVQCAPRTNGSSASWSAWRAEPASGDALWISVATESDDSAPCPSVSPKPSARAIRLYGAHDLTSDRLTGGTRRSVTSSSAP